MTESIPTLEAFVADAAAWLDDARRRAPSTGDEQKLVWGQGEFSVSVFHALSHDDERALLERAKAWTQAKAERGYHAIAAPVEDGGLGYPRRVRPGVRPPRAPVRATAEPRDAQRHDAADRADDPAVGHARASGPSSCPGSSPPASCAASCSPNPAPDPTSPTLVVPGRPRRRRVGRQRPEGVELGRPVRRVGRADRPHRRRRPEAPRHDGVHRSRWTCPASRSARSADERRGVVQRGVLHRRAGRRLDAPRRRGRRLAGRPDDARLRARPLRQRRRQPRRRRLAAPPRHGPGDGRHGRPGHAASARRRLHRRARRGVRQPPRRRAGPRRHARAGGLARQAAVDRGHAPHVGRRSRASSGRR